MCTVKIQVHILALSLFTLPYTNATLCWIFHVLCYFLKKITPCNMVLQPFFIPLGSRSDHVLEPSTNSTHRNRKEKNFGGRNDMGLRAETWTVHQWRTRVLSLADTYQNCNPKLWNSSMLLHYPRSNITTFVIPLPSIMTCLILNTVL